MPSPVTVVDSTNANVSSGTTTWGDGTNLAVNAPATVASGATLVLNVPSVKSITGTATITVLPGGTLVLKDKTFTVKEGSLYVLDPRNP